MFNTTVSSIISEFEDESSNYIFARIAINPNCINQLVNDVLTFLSKNTVYFKKVKI